MVREERTVHNNKKWRTTSALLAALVLSTSLSLPVWADSIETRVLTLQKGSSAAVVNGKSYSIAKPYIKQGVVMVPVGVFKKAFGSVIRLEGNNRVRVLQGPHVVVMSIGSTTAWVDGKKIALPVEPQMVSGTLMVPLRSVAQGIGAKVSKDKNGKLSISLVVTDKEGTPTTNTGIDSTAGKTRIGNSYYEWSMNYPSGMVIGGGADNESVSAFADATGRYYLEVHATAQQVELDTDDLLQRIEKDAQSSGDVVLDSETVTQVSVPYARVISKDSEGILWEVRAYYANNKVYEIYFADGDASHYKDLDYYAGLLNSFKPSFNVGDKSLKDLSSIENGLRSVMNTDYGIVASVPADWKVDNQAMFYGDEENGYLSIRVTSAPKGQEGTLEGWADQMKSWIGEAFVPGSYEIASLKPVEISGGKGQIQEIRYNYGDGWTTEYQVMLQNNGYRYYLEYNVPEGKEETARAWDDVLKSIYIDYEAVPSNFGRIGEEAFLMDKSKVTARSSKAYQYKVSIPRYWTAINDRYESYRVEYGFIGGRFEILSERETDAENVISELKQYFNEAATSKRNKVKLLSTENITFAGVPAVSFKSHHVQDNIGYTSRDIVFESGGVTYTISTAINDANATEAQNQAIEKALASFELLK
ncbi:copper amine oxidase N-terminal domain-containing protein [Paenibacillus sp. GCM10028914]|uniref:copper amine oxidase N-terminal domain-containing protein n=1 Tax=Paenibacillus sp. GCM10028914 TaxID=3273416 RepID=UPI003614DE14